MPAAIDVPSQDWTDVRVLFDNGQYSVISGTFHDVRRQDEPRVDRCIGVRWNGDAGRRAGFPSRGTTPIWHREPPMLISAILSRILEIAQEESSQHRYIPAIQAAIAEFNV